MAKCNCSNQVCSCVIIAGDGVTVTGSGTPGDPFIIESVGGEPGAGDWQTGDLKEVAHGDTPAGWLECLGQAVSRATYAALYAVIGTTYGAGNGTTTFNLPSYTGRAKVGAGPGFPLGAAGGAATVTLVTANLPAHTHSINHNHAAANTSSSGVHDHSVNLQDTDGTSGTWVRQGIGSPVGATTSPGPINNDGAHTHSVDLPAYVGDSGATGEGIAFSVRDPYRVVRVLVKT